MRAPRLSALAAVTVLAAGALAGCAPSAESSSGIRVLASTNVWGDVAASIGGDAVEVESIIQDASQDPHEYAASASDLARVAGADVVLINGGGYDDFAEQLVAGASSEAIVIDVSELAPRGSDNEHYWFDLATVQAVGAQLAAAYCELDESSCSGVTGSLDRFLAELDALRAALAGAGLSGAGVLMTEALPFYLFAEAGVSDETPVELARAVEAGSEIPAVALLEAERLLASGELAALALNAQTASAQTDRLERAAVAAGVPVLEFSELLPEGSSYLDWMRAQVEAVLALG